MGKVLEVTLRYCSLHPPVIRKTVWRTGSLVLLCSLLFSSAAAKNFNVGFCFRCNVPELDTRNQTPASSSAVTGGTFSCDIMVAGTGGVTPCPLCFRH